MKATIANCVCYIAETKVLSVPCVKIMSFVIIKAVP